VDIKNHGLDSNETDNAGYAYVQITGDPVRIIERGQGTSPWDPKRRSSPTGNTTGTVERESHGVIVKRKRLGKVHVTFVQAPREEPVFVAGTFNGWEKEPLKVAKDGTVRATVAAQPGETLAFRYVTASGEWFDDEAADGYAENDQGTTNGLVQV
jgi:1,4-alpha-glucan branching enzyme